MQITETSESLREQLADWRQSDEHIALVPTMGNLHDGHLSLVEIARQHAERVVVSIFVNPTQFGDGEDFAAYPKTLELDKRRLKRANVDLLFVPNIETMYPFGVDNATSVTVPVLTDELCGSFRPGHFDGVTSVVSRLFSLVQPDVAIFGEKDFQQLMVIRRLVKDMSLPVEIIAGPTRREEDELALSSRNQYLTEEERAIAPQLYATLIKIGEGLQSGKRNYTKMEQQAMNDLEALGFKPDYVSIRRAENLGEPDRDTDELVVLVAAHLGKSRLIDNLAVHI
ncbi:MAG: pantoate--beta-alanine ligase [Gammaproteobacteria bacterium]|nr:MAG: pantoate--beta-alanine ligase [Gammaproteobacteria bacterium]